MTDIKLAGNPKVLSRPRIRPVTACERNGEINALLHTVTDDMAALNIFATIVRHPDVFRLWSIFATIVLNGLLPTRDRDLLILRTAHNCGCQYEWRRHVQIAQANGLTAEQTAAVRAGPEWPGWTQWDSTVLTAADELHQRSRLSDVTWAALAERYNDQGLIEVPIVVGNCRIAAFTANSLGIELEGESGVPDHLSTG